MKWGLEWTKKRSKWNKPSWGNTSGCYHGGLADTYVICCICEIRHHCIEQNIAVYLWVSSTLHWPPLFLGFTKHGRKLGILYMTPDSSKDDVNALPVLYSCCNPLCNHILEISLKTLVAHKIHGQAWLNQEQFGPQLAHVSHSAPHPHVGLLGVWSARTGKTNFPYNRCTSCSAS